MTRNGNHNTRKLNLESLGERTLMAGDFGIAIEVPSANSFIAETIVSNHFEIDVNEGDSSESDRENEDDCSCHFDREKLNALAEQYKEQFQNPELSDDARRDIRNLWDRLEHAVEAIDRNNPNAAATALQAAAERLNRNEEFELAAFVYEQAGIGYRCGEREDSADSMFAAAKEALAAAEATGDTPEGEAE